MSKTLPLWKWAESQKASRKVLQILMFPQGFDWFLYWIIAGCPFGIRRMCLWLIPKNFGISGSIGVIALNCIIGGLIGGVVLIFKIIRIIGELISIVTGHFWTKSPKVEI